MYFDKLFIGLILEGFFYGLYSGIFAMYLRFQASNKGTDRRQNTIFYSICALYGLSVGLFVFDIGILPIYEFFVKQTVSGLHASLIEAILLGCCDFIAQFILIYRCWIVWGCNIRVIITPSILAFASLVTWIASNSSAYISSDRTFLPDWGYVTTLLGPALSLTVNALVTSLIVFRIFKVFREVRVTKDEILGTTGGSKLRRIIFVLIESGMALFSIQLVRLVLYVMETDAARNALLIIMSIHNILNGITPTIILVRTSMGLSFHDEKSMEEAAVGSLCFAFNDSNSVPETEGIGQDDGEDDSDLSPSNDIEIV